MRILALLLLLAGPVVAGEAEDALTFAARGQIGVTLIYDGSYAALTFPGGDIDRARGVCSDVLIRAMRDGWGVDLQLAVYRDMKADFAAYPKIWGARGTDRNIDHRRVPNLATLFRRIGAALPLTSDPGAYLQGDIVSWMLPGNLPHIGIVSDKRSSDGLRPLILHNIGAGAREEDMLFNYEITDHFRIHAEALARLRALSAP
jgi:uncharacterized protein YijF (DUF1287 family)